MKRKGTPERGGRRKAEEWTYDASVLLDEHEAPGLVRQTILAGFLTVAAFLTWASFAPLEEIETASGEIVPADDTVKVQHLSGGVLTEMATAEGAVVRTGDLLFRLGGSDSETIWQQSSAHANSLRAQRERITALAENRRPDFSFLQSGMEVAARDQTALYEAQRRQDALSRSLLERQVENAEAEAVRASERKAAIGRRLSIAEEDADIARGLVERGMAPRTELLSKLQVVETLRAETETIAAEERRADAAIAEAEEKLAEYRASFNRQLMAELATVNERIEQSLATMNRTETPAGRAEIRAPTEGIVHAIAFKTKGSVIPPGATILEILPTGKAPKASIRIDPKGIGNVAPGQKARIKVSAFPYDTFGGFEGILVSVSPSTFKGADGRTYYQGTVEIQGRELTDAKPLALLPGMTLSAELRTGGKTLMQYLLKPIFASARESFRER